MSMEGRWLWVRVWMVPQVPSLSDVLTVRTAKTPSKQTVKTVPGTVKTWDVDCQKTVRVVFDRPYRQNTLKTDRQNRAWDCQNMGCGLSKDRQSSF